MKRKFFRVFGMTRSGIHAVAEWVRMSHAEVGYSCHYDNAVSMDRPNELAKFLAPKGDLTEHFLWMVEHEDIIFLDMPVISPKIYENFECCDVLVIRDVFNTMASRKRLHDPLFTRRAIQQWKSFAWEALDKTQFIGPNKIVVKYNQWFIPPHEGERAAFAKKFGIEGIGSDTTKLAVASSWEPPTTPAHELKVLERWKNYVDDAGFWKLFDSQVVDLNTLLFGRNEEVEKLIK